MHLNLKVIGIYVFVIIQLLMIGNANAFNSGMNVHPATFPNEPFVLLQTLKSTISILFELIIHGKV